ncbi:MAG: hypothetical protein Q8M26_14010 [Pseudolabrys sp.]|nr:hypothetical protein [Pseudolabrys sp.]
MIDRARFWICDILGYALCELAFKTGCCGPFAWSYRAGCWFYGQATDAGLRCGALVNNPAFGAARDQPLYVRR